MSKRTSYGKFTVRTSAHIRVYPADELLPADGFLPSTMTVKNRVRAGALMQPRGHKPIRVDIGASISPPYPSLALHGLEEKSMRTGCCVRADAPEKNKK
jgi:hypothetical protein